MTPLRRTDETIYLNFKDMLNLIFLTIEYTTVHVILLHSWSEKNTPQSG